MLRLSSYVNQHISFFIQATLSWIPSTDKQNNSQQTSRIHYLISLEFPALGSISGLNSNLMNK